MAHVHSFRDHFFVQGQVIVEDTGVAESFFYFAAHLASIEAGDPADAADHIRFVAAYESGEIVFYYFGYGAIGKPEDGRSAGHRFGHDDAEGFVPLHRHQ